jgi:mRNA-degrading endonuclease RelE of RelBE toxin-antitoxin system
MPTLPLIFDTIPGVGATKLHAACLYPLLHPREHFGNLAVVVDFSPFWAGKFRRRAKKACAILSTIACRAIIGASACGKPLKDELAGLRSFRVGRFRIIYRMANDRLVEVVAIGPRRCIYEETYRKLQGKDR